MPWSPPPTCQRFSDVSDLSDPVIGPATQEALREFSEYVARSVQESLVPALEAFAVSIEMPRLPGLEAALAKVAEQVSVDLPTQELLASFGNEWADTLTKAIAAAEADLPQARTAIEAARNVEVEGTRG